MNKFPNAKLSVNKRIDELLKINDEIKNKDYILDQYSRKLTIKRSELEKKLQEIEIKEKEYIYRYQVCKIISII